MQWNPCENHLLKDKKKREYNIKNITFYIIFLK